MLDHCSLEICNAEVTSPTQAENTSSWLHSSKSDISSLSKNYLHGNKIIIARHIPDAEQRQRGVAPKRKRWISEGKELPLIILQNLRSQKMPLSKQCPVHLPVAFAKRIIRMSELVLLSFGAVGICQCRPIGIALFGYR